MDILFANTSVFQLPSSQRVGAIVYDGASDLSLWRGPGPDRDLLEAYGPELLQVLADEKSRRPDPALAPGEMLRLHPGKLHCDFLIWIATRGPEVRGDRASSPDIGVIAEAVEGALEFAASRNVLKIAFPALGGGAQEQPAPERLAAVVRGASRYHERCFEKGRPAGIEEVLVCHPKAAELSLARRAVGSLAKNAPTPTNMSEGSERPPRRAARTAGQGGSSKPRRGAPRLDPNELEYARTKAPMYDRHRTYITGDWLLHPKFGAGRVELTTAEGAIQVLFEDGELRKMVHARPVS